ncbi:glycoside hydrolase family 47 protein [Tieghemostelium lacteum]|uniref:alpha-1,2-Mannosidase n=1 Tax=Tieghemostelium lacteum TaxID=361077 RepID=A0A152A2T3_TIELA|nr:glycoside hydrolase family 47 protein [Tieghemostelium lacteum]|eukprot:KYR00514.1 glycoside hydrolase family 47 protein [Tieghemostelium lacteum]
MNNYYYLLIIVCVLFSFFDSLECKLSSFYTPTEELKVKLREDVKDMFYHGYNNYMKYSFPMDELKPITCTGSNTFGQYALTFIDSLDTLAVLGNFTEFEKGVNWVIENIKFDNDMTVSVFETNIRVLGGLLSSHLLAEKYLGADKYKGGLLPLATDLGERLLVAFHTPTGIPYGTVNLLKGVPKGETTITCTAAGGTFSLEFGILSKLTGRMEFENAARRAVRAIWKFRSELDLVGNHIDIATGEWTIKESGIGTGIDSFFEYLLKSAVFFDDEEYMDIFLQCYKAINTHIKKDNWYVEVNIQKASIVWPVYNSLQSYWPGLQTLLGDYGDGLNTAKVFHVVWRRYGFLPEGYNLISGNVQIGQKGYPLRPELAESLYYLYQANRDPLFIKMGKDLVYSLNNITRVKCGHAGIQDVEKHSLDDKMESFFLSETCKYLYLLFDTDDNTENTNPQININSNSNNNQRVLLRDVIFNTEGHIFEMDKKFYTKSDQYRKYKKIQLKNKQNYELQQQKREQEENSEENNNSENKDTTPLEGPTTLNEHTSILINSSKEIVNFQFKCEPLSYLRRISSGTFQFLSGLKEDEWYEDKKVIDALQMSD